MVLAHTLQPRPAQVPSAPPILISPQHRKSYNMSLHFTSLTIPLQVLYLSTPLVIPAGLSYAVLRLSRESSSSKKRLAQLTSSSDAESSLGATLRKMEMAVADVVDSGDPGVEKMSGWESDLEGAASDEEMKGSKPSRADDPEADAERGAGSLPSPLLTPRSNTPLTDPLASKYETTPKLTLRTKPDPEDPLQPMLTPGQLAMIESLNSIPQLRKERAYFPYAKNAHSMIIARDSERYPGNLAGLTVIRHWADRFVL
jgi:hypothetical protein